MERTEQHEIDSLARRLFESKLPGWIISRLQPQDDYGIDGELEILDGPQKTGIIIKVQIKGSKAPDYLSSSEEIALPIDVPHLNYFLDEVDIPLALILCDVTKNIVYWSAIQIDSELISQLREALKTGQKSITVKFQIKNTIPETLKDFLEMMTTAQNLISLKIASKTTTESFAQYLNNLETQDIDSELKQLKQKTEITTIEIISRLIRENALDKADKAIQQMLADDSYSALSKLNLLIITERFAIKADKNHMASFYLWQSKQMDSLKDKLEVNQQLIVEGYALTAKTVFLIDQYKHFHINWKLQGDTDEERKGTADPFWLTTLILQKAKKSKEILDQFSLFSKFINNLLEKKLFYLIPMIVLHFVKQFDLFLLILRREGKDDLNKIADELNLWTEKLINLTVSIVEQIKDQQERETYLGSCTVVLAMIACGNEGDLENLKSKVHSLLEKVKNPTLKKHYTEAATSLFVKIDKEEMDPEKPDWEFVKQLYVDQATAFGIRLDLVQNPKSLKDNKIDEIDLRLAQIIWAGIVDLDATLFLKSCIHMVYEFSGPRGEPARMLRLPSAGGKTVGCVKHPEHRLFSGLYLKALTSSFESNFCSNCPDKQPHEPNWVFNEPWLERQQELWAKTRKFKTPEW